jgi:CsoR family transcriptional regulator, copper-sensing transcriptional repressor
MQDSIQADVLARLKSVEGHVRGIQRMVTEGAYCMDIIKQNLAIQRALEKVNVLVLDGHLNSCVTTAIRGDDASERERVIRELLEVFDMTTKL